MQLNFISHKKQWNSKFTSILQWLWYSLYFTKNFGAFIDKFPNDDKFYELLSNLSIGLVLTNKSRKCLKELAIFIENFQIFLESCNVPKAEWRGESNGGEEKEAESGDKKVDVGLPLLK